MKPKLFVERNGIEVIQMLEKQRERLLRISRLRERSWK